MPGPPEKEKTEEAAAEPKQQAQNVTTNIPEDLKQFYEANGIHFRKFSEI